jgi:hypothetical protein
MARDFETPLNLKAGLLINGQPGATGQVPTKQADGSVAWQTPSGGPAANLFVYDNTSTANTIYTAQAPVGTAESATGWTVKRTTFSALGVQLTGPLTATGAWSSRTSLTYS